MFQCPYFNWFISSPILENRLYYLEKTKSSHNSSMFIHVVCKLLCVWRHKHSTSFLSLLWPYMYSTEHLNGWFEIVQINVFFSTLQFPLITNLFLVACNTCIYIMYLFSINDFNCGIHTIPTGKLLSLVIVPSLFCIFTLCVSFTIIYYYNNSIYIMPFAWYM